LIHVDRSKHLDLVQGVISRMAGNSFVLRGWAVTLVAGLLAVSAKETQIRFAVIALLPAVAFWGLDAFYLQHERLFRALYDHVRAASEQELQRDPYSLSTRPFRTSRPGWFSTLWTPAILGVHGVVVGSVAALIIMLGWR
jgi:hypothetical protein